MHKNPLLAVRIVVLVLIFIIPPFRRSLFGFDAHVVSAKRMLRRGEVTIYVSIFLVYILERDHKKKSSALIGSS